MNTKKNTRTIRTAQPITAKRIQEMLVAAITLGAEADAMHDANPENTYLREVTKGMTEAIDQLEFAYSEAFRAEAYAEAAANAPTYRLALAS